MILGVPCKLKGRKLLKKNQSFTFNWNYKILYSQRNRFLIAKWLSNIEMNNFYVVLHLCYYVYVTSLNSSNQSIVYRKSIQRHSICSWEPNDKLGNCSSEAIWKEGHNLRTPEWGHFCFYLLSLSLFLSPPLHSL